MKKDKTINVALADDHVLFRKGLSEIISDFKDIKIVTDGGNGQELINKLKELQTLPDVCILDINMPVMNGYETAKAIRKQWKDIKILALSMYDSEFNIIKMLRSGANGYVLKDTEPQELYQAIRSVHQNGFYHSDLVKEKIWNATAEEAIELEKHDLPDNEIQFMTLCCTELTYKEIAEKMSLSPRTIDGYRDNLFNKLNVTSRTGLVIYAIRNGVISVY